MARGGARPGAGRKKKTTENYQATMRSVFEEVVTQEDWCRVVMVAMAQAKSGDKAARDWLAPWIVGKVPDKVEHGSDPEHPMEMVVKIVRSSGNRKIDNAS